MKLKLSFYFDSKSRKDIDRPKEYLSKLKSSNEELYLLFLIELKEILLDPFDFMRSHELRPPWKGKYSWYPNKNSKAKDYRIIYSVEKKIVIYRIGHHSEVYRR